MVNLVNRRQRPAAFLLTVCMLLLHVSAASGQTSTAPTFVVESAQGAAGIVQALAAVRALRRSEAPPSQPVHIVLKPGDYVLDAPLTLTADDAGTAASPLIIEALQRNTVRLIGAPRLDLRAVADGAWLFRPQSPLDRAAERSGGQFYVNDRRAVLARQPKAGQYWLVAKADAQTLFGAPADVARLADLATGDADRALVNVMQSWTAGRHRIAAGGIDRAAAGVPLSPVPRWHFLDFGPQQRYFVENLPRAWTAAGEWIADGGSLKYRPLPAEGRGDAAARRAEAYWPRLPRLLVIQGSAAAPVANVELRRLGFAYSGQPIPPGGWMDNQAEAELPAAIELNHAVDIRLQSCDIRHTGAYAVWLNKGVRRVEVSDCLLDDLGAGGIKVGTEQTMGEPDQTSGNRITDNVVTRTGRDFPGAVGIWIGRSFDNRVASNVIAQTTYTGISVGWAWGYEAPTSGGNQIVDNVLLDIGQGRLSDLGAIYTLGRSPGTLVSGNYVRRVESFPGYGAGGWGLYNDEGSEGIVVENNVVVGTRSGGYQLHYGRDLLVRDNFFAGGGVAEIRWANVSKSGDWRFEDNGVELRADRGPFEFHNDDGKSGARTLRQLKLSQGMQPVKPGAGAASAGLFAVDLGGSDVRRQTAWRQVVANARRLVERARRAGVQGLDGDDRAAR